MGFLKGTFAKAEASAIVAARNAISEDEFFWMIPEPTLEEEPTSKSLAGKLSGNIVRMRDLRARRNAIRRRKRLIRKYVAVLRELRASCVGEEKQWVDILISGLGHADVALSNAWKKKPEDR